MKTSYLQFMKKAMQFIITPNRLRFLILVCFFYLSQTTLSAQSGVGINISGADALPSAILDVSSTTKGVLLPRMTNAQKLAIASPATGLTIYQTDAPKGYWFYNGTSWLQIGIFGNGSAAGNTPYWDGTNWIVNNSNIFNAGANVGIGMTSPGSKLQVSGSPVTKTSADSITEGILRLSRPAAAGKNGAMVEFALGSFNPTSPNSTSKLNINLASTSLPVSPITVMTITSAGNVGIGNSNPHTPLQFANTSDQRKLVLYETSNNDHQFIGFGNDEDGLKYQIDSSTSSHRFYSGINTSSSKELMRIKGDGKVGIGTATPANTFSVLGSDTGYLASFKNTNSTTGGKGIKISLGRVHPLWTGAGYRSADVGGLQTVYDGFNGIVASLTDVVVNHKSIDATKFKALGDLMGNLAVGTLCNLTNQITDKINTGMHLPAGLPELDLPTIHIWNKSVLFGGYSFIGVTIPELAIPALDIPSTKIYDATTIVPAIPPANCTGFPTITAPTINFTNVANSLDDNNYFLQFTDNSDRQLGGIRAQSIDNWKTNHLNLQFYMGLLSEFDALNIGGTLLGYLKEFYAMGQDYNTIGVEYISAHGDYAEWLERQNPGEYISEGDIVGVKSGKITKELTGAEQIMAVSHRPIVLGNMPEKSKQQLGNNVAFMGQIPVKILGPVKGGDYIIANGQKGGYGKAIHPSDMNVDDYRLVVGRSWETNLNEGPKMINTVVGVHNNGFLNIVKGMQQKIDNSEIRLKQIEATLNLNQNTTLVTNKK